MNIINIKQLTKEQNYWLNDAKNLVTSLSQIYGKIFLHKISQTFDNLNTFEQSLLQTKKALVRQITLASIDKTLVFARTIIPNNTYKYFSQEIDKLNNKPIGDNLLFDKNRFTRENFIIRKLNVHDFYNETKRNTEHTIFSRSSIFKYKKNLEFKILITEYFITLPETKNG